MKAGRGVSALSIAECEMIGRLLESNYNNQIYSDIWQFGLNVPLRISDMLKLPMNCLTRAIENGREVFYIHTEEMKTDKLQSIQCSESALEVIRDRQKKYPNDYYLFQSHSNRARAMRKPISRIAVYKAFSEMGNRISRKIGCHTTRKSRGKYLYESGMPIERLQAMFNHSTAQVTLRYIGIEKQELNDSFHQYQIRTRSR